MGGLMMADVLAGNFSMSNSVFNSNLSMLVTCWYIVNHNIPFTKFNLWDLISDNVSKFVPLGNVMDLCTTMFNLSLLHSVCANAGQMSGDLSTDAFYGNIVTLGAAITWAVAHHCAGDFFSTDGFAFWYASNGLATLPLLGKPIGNVTSQIEGLFGGRTNFLNMYVLAFALAGHLIPVNPQAIVQDALYKVFGVSR